MGNAYTALADDFSGFYHNPAGPATRPRDVLTLGYLSNRPSVMVRSGGGPEQEKFSEKIQGGVCGFSLDVGQFFPERYRPVLVAGLAAVFPDSFKTFVNADIMYFDEMTFPVYGRVQDFSLIFMGAGLRLHRMLYVGASARIGFTADIRNINLLFDVTRWTDPEVTFYKLDINPDLEVSPIVGVIFMPWKSLRLGAVWRRGGNPVTFMGTVDVTVAVGPVQIELPDYSLFVQEFYNPEEIAASLAFRPLARLLLAVDVTWARWSGYNLPYGERPPGDPFHDIVIPRLGAEFRVLEDLRVRLGYGYHPSPVSRVQPYTQLLDTDQHVFSTGLGYAWGWPARWIAYPLVFDLYFQYKYLPERTLETVAGDMTVHGRHVNIGGSIQLQF